MCSGYHHVEITEEARPKTAFTLPANLGKSEFLWCPCRLAQAPASFQRLINEVLAPFDFAFGYLDILIYSLDVATHLKHLTDDLSETERSWFETENGKVQFSKETHSIKPVPEKLSSIQRMPHPSLPKEVKQFLGLVGYYRKFIPDMQILQDPWRP